MGKKAQMKEKGFTLIELLVVISIIAILAAIMIPAVQEAMLRAKITQSIANIKAFSPALSLYSMKNDDMYPVGSVNDAAHHLAVLAIEQELPEALFFDPVGKIKGTIDDVNVTIVDCPYGYNLTGFGPGAKISGATTPIIGDDPANHEGEGAIILTTDNAVKFYKSDHKIYIAAYGTAITLEDSEGVIVKE